MVVGTSARRGPGPAIVLVIVWAVLAAATTAHAQDVPDDATLDRLDVHLWRPGQSVDDYLAAESGSVLSAGRFSAGLFMNYERRPLVAFVERGGDRDEVAIVDSSVLFDLTFAYGIYDRLQLGIDVAVISEQAGDLAVATAVGRETTLGDLRFDAKLRLVGPPDGGRGLSLAAALGLTLPVGSDDGFASSGAWGVRPRVIVEGRGKRGGVSSTLGLHLRTEKAEFIDIDVQHELELSVAGRLLLGRSDFALLAEGDMRVGINDPGIAETPLELLGGVAWRGLPGLELLVASGAGLTEGYGTPKLRILLGVRVAADPLPHDFDRDGMLGSADACPEHAGPRENRGCPDEDRDGDGVVDRLDHCVAERGDAGHGGCPPKPAEKDTDLDMVVDRQDHCPEVKGSPDNLGCPDGDGDGDGIIDRNDPCPSQAGPRENVGCPDTDGDHDEIVDRLDKCPATYAKTADGCPPPDQDGDGYADDVDKCPGEPEVFNGVGDEDGCPDAGPALVEITREAIVIKEQVFFDTGKARIQKRSFKLLATVAQTLTLHPEIQKVRVEGHTDTSGNQAKNKKLSQARADAVVKHLVEVNGIDATRLEAVGFGQDQPLNDNSTAKLRAANRRVEFKIVVRAGEVTDAAPAAPPPQPANSP